MRAIFTGSFDPVTNGHLDLIQRVLPLAESLVVAVAVNSQKEAFFAIEDRLSMLRASCMEWPQVIINTFSGLVVQAAREVGADTIVRGIRNSADLEHEMQMALMNRTLAGIETLLLPADTQWAFVSSSLIKEVARLGGDITPFVPVTVAESLRRRLLPS